MDLCSRYHAIPIKLEDQDPQDSIWMDVLSRYGMTNNQHENIFVFVYRFSKMIGLTTCRRPSLIQKLSNSSSHRSVYMLGFKNPSSPIGIYGYKLWMEYPLDYVRYQSWTLNYILSLNLQVDKLVNRNLAQLLWMKIFTTLTHQMKAGY